MSSPVLRAPSYHRSPLRRVVPILVALMLALLALPLTSQRAAAAGVQYNVIDSDSGHVTADALPTVQIDTGVVWTTAISGDMVFAGGQFSNARPYGAAAGTSLTPRSNVLAFSLSTGNLITSWAPTVNGVVKAMALSPDKSVLYIGGNFNLVNGQSRPQIAALDAATGAVLPFRVVVNTTVNAIAVSPTMVYFGGEFTQVNGQSRPYLAAASTAGVLSDWAPVADYPVRGMAMTPDNTRVIVGGAFSRISGATSPSLASLDATTGTLFPFAANQVIQNYGTSASIWSLKSDGTNILTTGYWYGGTGNFEGVAVLDPYSGAITNMVDCHGDTYNSASMNGVLYAVSHHHTCANVDTQPQQNPWRFQYSDSWTLQSTGTVRHNVDGGYHDFFGQPAPSQYDWYPTLVAGTFTGLSQAAWSSSASNGYLVLGGEFTRINTTNQYGLTRFAVPSKSTNQQGPVIGGNNMKPTLTAIGNAVKVNWPSNWDRDDQTLTYTLMRQDRGNTPIYTTQATTQWWNLPTMGYLDTGLATSTNYSYQVIVSDPDGHRVLSLWATVTTGTTAMEQNPYSQAVLADGAAHYWRFTEPSGSTTVIDWAGVADLSPGSGVSLGQTGFMSASSDTSASFDGTNNGRAVSTAGETGTDTLSIETWIRTTTTKGGKIIGFGDSPTLANSSSYDRHVYMDDSGRIVWGVYPGGTRTVSSAKSYNDGQWHQVVATLSSAGQVLYVDGLRVGIDTSTTSAQSYAGYWHIGGDNLGGWPSQPSSMNFSGLIDDTSIYPTALSVSTIRAHYAASGRTVDLPQRPSDTYGGLVYDDNPSLYWRLDEITGTTALDASQNLANGTYSGITQQGKTPAVAGTAVQFNGANAGVYANDSATNPTVYSEEAWFKTTTTKGGKIVGFGDQQSGLSSNYDRHVYLDTQGKVNFGVWTGQANVITSTNSYNDNLWHHMVATEGASGMALYLDGVLVGTNANNQAQDYTGYWRIGGDTSWSGANYFAGQIDEVAVYGQALTIDQVRAHYRAATVTRNQEPVASYTLSCDTFGNCAADGSASADPDGAIASYQWTVDGTVQGSTTSALVVVLPAGNHTFGLKVTDDQGLSSTSTQTVTVTVQNRAPVAAFDDACSGLTCSFDGSLSSDPDGTIVSYAWDFGDGGTSTVAKPSHTFTAGDHTVSLTVTDDQGATNVATKTITVSPLLPPTASFTSKVTNTAVAVDASGSTDPDGTISSYAWDFGDGSQGVGRTANHTYASGGDFVVTLTVTDNTGLTDTTTQTVTIVVPNQLPVAAFTSAETGLQTSLDASTSSDPDGTIASYAWNFGDGTSGTGRTVNHTYASANTYTVTLIVTDNEGGVGTVSHTVTVQAPNQPPVASFTSTVSGLGVTVNGSGSSDPDGTIASYAWDFGDGGTATGATASHTYATANSYNVSLTVTDNSGASTTIMKSVTVTAPAANVIAKDSFPVNGSGWGTAEVGGTYTYSGASSFSRSNGVGLITLAKGGSGPLANLPVSVADLTYTGGWSIDKFDNGGGVYVQLLARRSSSGDYRVKVKVQSTGAVTLVISKVAGGTEKTLASRTLTGVTYVPGTTMNITTTVIGTTSVSISASTWLTGTAKPATPQLSVTDANNPLGAGSFATQGYLSGSATNFPIVVSIKPYEITAP